jgi:dipeptidyl aminopeptidase/acylaminoacyl peptidase
MKINFLSTTLFTVAALSTVAFFSETLAGAVNTANNHSGPILSRSVPPHIITQRSIQLTDDRMTPELLWSIGRVSDPQVSPDQKSVLFGVKWYDIAENQGNRELYLMNIDGSGQRQITRTILSENSAKWRPDGKKIGFVYDGQFWEMDPDGSSRQKLTDLKLGVTGFLYAPQMDRILFTSPVAIPKVLPELYEGLDKTTGRIIDDLMYRHWDSWVDTYSHVLVADYTNQGIANITDIMAGEPWESPMAPFGGLEQMNWSPDGKIIAYTSRKKKGKDYALSTNSDIYLYDVDTRQTVNLTEGMMGYDTNPAFSPDGGRIAWLSMERDGYEADENRLFVYDFKTQTKTFLTSGLDQDVSTFIWSTDSGAIYFISDHQATDQIYRIDLPRGAVTKLTDGLYSYTGLSTAGNRLITTRYSMAKPEEIYWIDPATGQDRDISRINQPLMDQLAMGQIQQRWVKTTDNKNMLTWVVLPPHFNASQKYPTLLYCVGGPEATINQNWSYRWNLQTMAAKGYVVVAPNRRGVPGFGREWKEAVLGDWGGQPMKDLLSAIDDVRKEPWVDNSRLAAVGPSFGGFSVFWLAGNHDKRFKAFIAHDGIFNMEMMYLETEEMWFANSEYSGPFWNSSDPAVQHSYAGSPHRFVQNWDTPILVIHGEKDYRVPPSQGTSAFNAAILRDIPAQLLYLPDQGHWVLTPQDSLLWHRAFFNWLDRWLK